MRSPAPQFGEWIESIFGHEGTEPAWYWQAAETPNLNPEDFLEFCTRLFSNSGEWLKPYSDGQVNHGLYFLISTCASDGILALKDRSISVEARCAFLDQIFVLNRDCFTPRCTPHLSHLDRSETPSHVSPLNSICYMWWDIFIIYGDRDDPAVDPLNRTCLRVMEQSLCLSNVAVQEGALHGLGHFALYYPQECQAAVEKFLHANQDAPPALLTYAAAAKTGCIL